MKRLLLAVSLILFSSALLFSAESGSASSTKVKPLKNNRKVSMSNRIAKFTTNMGEFKVELFEDKAPITTKNFISLAEKGYYNGLIFHRVIDKFMIQGGDPTGTGSGGPGYTIKDEFSKDLRHDGPGVLSMANAGPNTGGSQFFITLVPTQWLDGHHSVFGKVIEGLDIVQKIGKVKTGPNDRPVSEVVMEKITIESK